MTDEEVAINYGKQLNDEVRNHWITASTILSIPGCIGVHNFLFDDVDADTTKLLLELFGKSQSNCRKCRSNKVAITVACLPLHLLLLA